MDTPIQGRAVCDERASLCHCVKDAGHVEAGDPVHGCDEKVCTGQWSGTFDDSHMDGGDTFAIVRLPRPVDQAAPTSVAVAALLARVGIEVSA